MSAAVKLSAVLLLVVSYSSAFSQDLECDGCCAITPLADAKEGGFTPDDLWTRSTLTGDWWGLRSTLKESGFTFSGQSTQFGFGVAGGIDRLAPIPLPLTLGDTFEYTGRGSYDFRFDLEKFGGLPHGSLLVQLQHWYGTYGNVSLKSGAFAPPVFAAALPPAPNDQGTLFLSDFVITQPLSENFVVFAGKKNVLGTADQDEFAGGNGTDQFMNQAFVANPAFLLALPYTGFVVGAASPQEWGSISAFAYDPKDRTQDFFDLGDLYAAGVILGTELSVKTNFFGLKGDQHVGGLWKHVDMTDLRFSEPPPGVYPEPTVPGFPTLANSWTLYYGFDQYLVQFAEKGSRGWGLFGRASISDANPTPIRFFLSAGLGGDSNLRPGKQDKWGIGWYYTGVSDQFGPLPQALFAPRDGTGVELYYNFQVTPWMNVTPDVQFLRTEVSALSDHAIIYGVRVNIAL